MASPPCFPKTTLSFVMFLVLLMSMGANRVAKAQAGLLPDDEALQEIATQLGKKDWNFGANPCIDSSWRTLYSNERPLYNNTVNCNCSYPDGVCHLVHIFLKGQDLAGTLPPSLVKLPYLKAIDFNRNYLSGTIPREWASTKLENLSISANNLSGRIDYLGKITTLKSLTIESNLFSGPVPTELGNLVDLEKLILNANNLTGELPATFTNLTKLQELRISSNTFSGRMPDFFQSWIQLQELEIQASGFEGPIPTSISVLSNLTDLRISDLLGEGSSFPPLKNMRSLVKLMLRSCNISGPIPAYISELAQLKILDLSFNRLEGKIPDFGVLASLDVIYLTGNLLSGPIPEWIESRDSRRVIDLSYNNFSASSAPNTCPDTLNLFRSFSGSDNSILTECLKNNPCSKDQHSLHINCGGEATTIGDVKYEADLELGGAAKFVRMKDDTWGFSSTGDFWDVWGTSKDYIAENVSRLRMNDSLLYMNARLSPLSLTYYVRCLANGNYTVKLHFAEIIFGDNKSFSSVGRRMFDVYIQNELVLKDFDIEKEAQGIDKAVIRNFTAIVKYKTLEIRFYWSGKGTQDIPMRGTYGSLISAIAIDSKQSLKHNRRLITAIGISAAVAGIAVISFVIICTIKRGHFPINSMVRWKRDAKNDHFNTEEIIKNYGSIAPKRYTYSDVKKFTNSFKDKVGEGGYGVVYKGKLPDGRMVAAKILGMSKGNGEEFINEVASISRTSHVNIVTLLGFCYERTKRALIYEFMPSGSLDKFIYDKGSQITNFQLDSKTMFQIAIGIARGLEYLHRGCNTRILHFDIKPQNILLDEDLCPKISDFGLAKLCKTKDSIVSMTGMRGTIGYIAPEVFSRNFGGVSYKSDVYSYGMLVLEMVGARKNFDGGISHTSEIYFPHWIYSKLEHGESLGTLGDITEEEEDTIKKMILVSLWCTQTNPSDRPSMDKVIDMLEGSLQSLQFPPKSSMYSPVRSPQDSFPTSESHILTL